MRPDTRALALLAAAALLVGCGGEGPAAPAGDSPAAAAEPAEEPAAPSIAELAALKLPRPGAVAPPAAGAGSPETAAADGAGPDVPHIYLALQPGGTGHPTSVVFAIDAARDGTPSNDPAMRLTPEAGRCNPQELRGYAFPEGTAPVVSEAERARGLTARNLPRFLAATVTGRMIEAGLASEPEATRGLNVCTRKLWERLVVAESRDQAAAGQ